MSPDLAFQTAIKSAITSAVSPTVVTAHPTPSQALPYVRLGESFQYDSHNTGYYIEAVIDVFSSAHGPHEAKAIGELINAALHDSSPTYDTWKFVGVRQSDYRVFVDEDNETWHLVVQYRCLASPV